MVTGEVPLREGDGDGDGDGVPAMPAARLTPVPPNAMAITRNASPTQMALASGREG